MGRHDSTLISKDYGPLLTAVRERIRSAQYEALRSVNHELVELYWDLGRMIVEQQQDESWGRSVVKRLAKDLQAELPGVSGFSASNLWYMRKLYLAYRNKENSNHWLEKSVGAITRSSWTAARTISSASITCGWPGTWVGPGALSSTRSKVSPTRRKTLLSQTNFAATLPHPIRDQARLAVKDSYTFDFLEPVLAVPGTHRPGAHWVRET